MDTIQEKQYGYRCSCHLIVIIWRHRRPVITSQFGSPTPSYHLISPCCFVLSNPPTTQYSDRVIGFTKLVVTRQLFYTSSELAQHTAATLASTWTSQDCLHTGNLGYRFGIPWLVTGISWKIWYMKYRAVLSALNLLCIHNARRFHRASWMVYSQFEYAWM
jgi:hypothetical protein